MWLRRIVGLTMIVTCIGMIIIVLVGFFTPDKTKTLTTVTQQVALSPVPTVTITASPGSISAGGFSAISWTSTGNPTQCTASDNWTGIKTPYGSESTGRISSAGQFKYTLTCTNSGGTGTASVAISVSPANVAPPPAQAKSVTSTPSTSSVSYCGGRSPCYNASEVSKHGSSGNCWGWLGDRVINVSGFDASFHVARSGVSSIQVSGVCGKDLGPAVNGQVSTSEYPSGHAHQLGAKDNSDQNYLGYFVGYFDNSKP